MLLTVDLDREELVTWPGGERIRVLRMKRRRQTLVKLQFVRCGQIVAVGSGQETGVFTALPREQFTDSPAFQATSWIIVEGKPLYVFLLNLNTEAVQTIFTAPALPAWVTAWEAAHPGCTFPPPQPPASTTLSGEIAWTDDAGYQFNTLPFAIELENALDLPAQEITGLTNNNGTPILNNDGTPIVNNP